MDDINFDRCARNFAGTSTRRSLLALLGAVAAFRGKGALGAQLGPATCGASGDVCTLLSGCCDGLTCVTSTINTSYGVCVPGDGGMVASGTSLISPFSEGVVEEIGTVTSPASDSTSTTATDQQAERDAKIAAQKARRDSRRTKIQSRRTEQQTKKEAQQLNRATNEEADRIAAGPLVEGRIFNRGGNNGPETLKITNRDVGEITLTDIEPTLDPSANRTFPPGTEPVLEAGESFNFYSERSLFDSGVNGPNQFAWKQTPICTSDALPGAGFRVYVAFNSDSASREYEFPCDTPFVPAPVSNDDASGGKRKKPNKRREHHDRARAKTKSRTQKKNVKR